jgi:hypothetical protein
VADAPRVGSPRRYRLLKRLEARRQGDAGLEGAWRSKQEATTPATALPADFPFLTTLAAAGYSTEEDLTGADADELTLHVPTLHRADVDAILAALALL